MKIKAELRELTAQETKEEISLLGAVSG